MERCGSGWNEEDFLKVWKKPKVGKLQETRMRMGAHEPLFTAGSSGQMIIIRRRRSAFESAQHQILMPSSSVYPFSSATTTEDLLKMPATDPKPGYRPHYFPSLSWTLVDWPACFHSKDSCDGWVFTKLVTKRRRLISGKVCWLWGKKNVEWQRILIQITKKCQSVPLFLRLDCNSMRHDHERSEYE